MGQKIRTIRKLKTISLLTSAGNTKEKGFLLMKICLNNGKKYIWNVSQTIKSLVILVSLAATTILLGQYISILHQSTSNIIAGL